MRLSRIYLACLLGTGLLSSVLPADVSAQVSRKELEQVERQVQAQNKEHQKLQEQAAKINNELKNVNQQMIKAAKQIQNNEEAISKMEAELEELTKNLKEAESSFVKEDENLIKTLSALQSLALKPTESLFVQPLTPVEIIRSAMLLRETVPFWRKTPAGSARSWKKSKAKKRWSKNRLPGLSVRRKRWRTNTSR